MKINARLEEILNNRLFPGHSLFASRRAYNIYKPNLNTAFLKSVVDREEHTVIIPCFMFLPYTQMVCNANFSVTDVAIPLSVGTFQSYKSADSILTNILRYIPYRDMELSKITSEKYGTYYGTEGIILDKDFNILFMSAYKCKLEGGMIRVNSVITYVNPIVSIAENGVEKQIYTKVVPLCLTTPVRSILNNSTNINNPFVRINISSMVKPTVVFEDITNKFLIKPIAPNPYTESTVQDILMSSIENIIQGMSTCQ